MREIEDDEVGCRKGEGRNWEDSDEVVDRLVEATSGMEVTKAMVFVTRIAGRVELVTREKE